MPCSSSLISHREGAANEHFIATGGGFGFEVTAVEADSERSCSVQGPIQTKISWLSIVELVTFTWKSRSTLVSVIRQRVSRYNRFRHGVWLEGHSRQ